MTEHKRNTLKELVKLKVLARLAGIDPTYLSSILNNNKRPSRRLAESLAHHANTLVNSDFFTSSDFLD